MNISPSNWNPSYANDTGHIATEIVTGCIQYLCLLDATRQKCVWVRALVSSVLGFWEEIKFASYVCVSWVHVDSFSWQYEPGWRKVRNTHRRTQQRAGTENAWLTEMDTKHGQHVFQVPAPYSLGFCAVGIAAKMPAGDYKTHGLIKCFATGIFFCLRFLCACAFASVSVWQFRMVMRFYFYRINKHTFRRFCLSFRRFCSVLPVVVAGAGRGNWLESV